MHGFSTGIRRCYIQVEKLIRNNEKHGTLK